MARPWERKPVESIEIGNTEGQYFTQWRFDLLKEVAEHVNAHVPISNVKLWYDRNQDFHMLEFDADGHHFTARLYKIVALYRDTDHRNNFHYRQETASWDIGQLFMSGRHLTWKGKRDTD